MADAVLDLEELVRAWVGNYPVINNKRHLLDEIRSADIQWQNVRIKHGPTEYFNQTEQSSPQTHVLFSTYFTNDTEEMQTYNLNTERRTTSTSTVSMDKVYTVGYSVDIKLAPPNPVVEANAGLKGEMSVTNSNEQTFEEELVWSVDNQISVPSKCRTKVDLLLLEDEYSSQFRCETRFKGKVKVVLWNKHDRSHITTLTGPVRDIFRPENGFRAGRSAVYFMSQGRCKSRYGIEQHIKLTQTEITEPTG